MRALVVCVSVSHGNTAKVAGVIAETGAMASGAVVDVPVRYEGDTSTTLLVVNGRMIAAAAAVVETHEISP